MSKQAQFTVNLNFANQSIEQTDEYAVFNINDFYDVHEASVSASELKGFVEESFEARLQKERQAIENRKKLMKLLSIFNSNTFK